MLETIDPRKTTLLLFELQNDFVHKDGKLHAKMQQVMEKTEMHQNLLRLIAAARRCGVAVLHVPMLIPQRPQLQGLMGKLQDLGAFAEDSWGVEFHADFQPCKADAIVAGKVSFDAFQSSNLDLLLRRGRFSSLIMCGFQTNICVESSARSACDMGFSVIVPRDCCACASVEEHEASLKLSLPYFATVTDHQECMTSLRNGAGQLAGTRISFGVTERMAAHLFAELDLDHNGRLEPPELQKLGRILGEKWDLPKLEEIYAAVDSDGNGTIDFSEFFEWLMNNCTLGRGTRSVRRRQVPGDLQLDPLWIEKLRFWDEICSDEAVHAGGAGQAVKDGKKENKEGSLRGHCISTAEILRRWGHPETTCLAALFHSVYETQGGHHAMGSALSFEQQRPKLQENLGTEVEELVWHFQSANRSTFPPLKNGCARDPTLWPLYGSSILFASADAQSFTVYSFVDNKTVLELPKRLRWQLLELVLANAFDQPAAMIDEDPEQAVLWCYQLRGCWGAPWPYLSEGCRNHLAQYLKSALEASSWGKVEQVAREALLEVRFPLRTTMLAAERNKLDPIDDVQGFIDGLRTYWEKLQPAPAAELAKPFFGDEKLELEAKLCRKVAEKNQV